MNAGGGLTRHIRLRSATALVVANIIGAGIFTTTGFQAAALGHPGFIFALWIVGGALAFCGALCYGELGAAMPEAGGEYVYLRETYGGAFGFMSAFVSLVAGFSAPIAAAAKGLVFYLGHFVPALGEETGLLGTLSANDLVAVAIVWALIVIHMIGVRGGIGFNDAVTLFKVVGIVAIILAAAAIGKGAVENLSRVAPSFDELGGADTLSAFATSLIFVMYCYSGWNAAAYVAGEMKNPQRYLPLSLLAGTGIVVLLYLGLNAVYFYGAGIEGMVDDQGQGIVQVGQVAARGLFGSGGVTAVTVVICVSMLASISAMTIAGPRVYFALGRDFPLFKFLARTGPATGAPTAALLVQGIVTTAIIVTGRIDSIQQYVGFTLTLFASLAVAAVIVLRVRRPRMERPFRAWGYPATPIFFLAVSLWMLIWAIRGRPVESMLALATVAAGGAVFYFTQIGSRGGAGD